MWRSRVKYCYGSSSIPIVHCRLLSSRSFAFLQLQLPFPLLSRHQQGIPSSREASFVFVCHSSSPFSKRKVVRSVDMSMRPKRPIKFRSLFKEEATEKDIQVRRLLCEDAFWRRCVMAVSRWICVKCKVPYRRSSCLEQTKRKRPV